MLNAPRLSLVPLGAEHFEPLAAMYADREIMRFLEPAPLDRGEAWRRLAMHVGHWALRGYATSRRPLAVCGRTGRGEGRAGNGFARASGRTFSLAATLTFPVVALEEFG